MAELPYDKLTIYEVEDFYEFLVEKVKNADSKLEFDFTPVKRIDMAAIQLLLSLKQTCKKESIDLDLKNFSSELTTTIKSCGCDMLLEVNHD